MTREKLFRLVSERYGTEPDYPWLDSPEAAVLRHGPGEKWYGLVMTLPRKTLGLPGGGTIDVINLKLDPALVLILLEQPGFLPAWHMNKKHWITALLDGSVPDELLGRLVDESFSLTRKKIKKYDRGEE